mmetsp:Transcript_17618/g.43962  ORF Transcript_17618/g.43962 Transcript_17618/m.43962 type:complete len:826 (-) Transcript_17618:1419-3896(-)
MSTVLAQNPAAAGGEGVGLSITISSEQDNDIKESDCTEPLTTAPSPTFIPPSVDPSPIPFEVDEDDEHAQTPAPVSSIMREPSSPLHPSPRPPQAHVDALEERVRDLEEKLSTLSMLLLQQNQRLSPQRKSPPSSPDSMSHSYDSSSLSPPTTPFRSLASFATIPSSNVPVLESPTPVMSTSSRRYRSDRGNNKSGKTNGDNILSGFSLPYEHRSPRQQTKKLPRRGLSKNLSYHILHSNDSELDFRNASGRNSSDEDDRGSSTTDHQTDDSFERACHVPSLDSLPGSSRTSPILSSDPVVARVLSPEQTSKPQESLEMSSSSSVEKKTLSPPPLTSPSQSAHSNAESVSKIKRRNRSNSFPIINMRNRSSSITSNNTSRISMSSKNNTAINNNNSMSEISNSGDTKHKKKKSNIKSKWLDYLNSVQESNYDTDKQMEEFVKVPSRVEALLSFGFWISVDSFLYTLTMLPLRSFYSIFLLTIWVYNKIVGRKASGIPQFHRHNTYHLIQMSIIYIIYATVLKPIDISIMYHMIRNQSMVKLYLLIAMVEVFDRLMCSLGQDCFDSLYWNTTRRPRSSRMVVAILLVLVYTGLHSFLLFVHVATLNVAMNSNDQALLSLLIGGNFAEIKSTVFKKYNKATLFKITASDICERFKLALFLFLVLMLNASQGMDQKMYYNYLSMCGVVVGGEWLSDWLKHSFITKFNFIASGVYSEYSLLLAGDVSGFGHEGGENLDKSHAVVKRLGLAQIPLVCVMAKYLKECYKYQTYTYQPQKWMLVVGTLSVWLLLLVTKLSLASVLQSMCKNKLETAPEFSKNNTTVAKKKNQ